MTVLWNGGPPDAGLAQSRGLHYGDGVFRSLLRRRGQWLDWKRQCAKLAQDCSGIGLNMPDAGLLLHEAESLCVAADDAVLKILCLRQPLERGYRGSTTRCDRLLLLYPLPDYSRDRWELGIAACRSNFKLALQPALAGIKHLNRLEQVLASTGWAEGVAEALICDSAGRPICGTRSNLFWARGGVVHTPDLAQSGVAGMMRQKLLELIDGLGLLCEVGQYAWSDLEAADEIWVCNSLIGIWPLRRLDARDFQAPGPITRKLVAQLCHPFSGF